MIDLRSDTATRPSREMRQFMADAEVGDEQIREDPTVNKLQDMVAELTGKEAALFLPSGTMCNAIGIKIHTNPGDKIILERDAHPFTSEAGGPALMSGVMTTLVDGDRGIFTGDAIRSLVPPVSFHSSPTTLVLFENTHNKGGGRVWPLEALNEAADVAHELGVTTHMDGARLLNAVVASDIPARVWSEKMDTVWIDLSKGLGAPVGGVLAGTREQMERARRYKHMFGGAMRQAGIVAAAGVYALEHNVERMADDHENARRLASGLSAINGIELVHDSIDTNLVFFDVSGTGKSAPDIAAALKEKGVLMGAQGRTRFRAVTHIDVSKDDIETALSAMNEVVAA
ncbi:MAG: GntG family PLP-dependent aldolase [Thermomicrobiaceae bacterium]